MLLAGGCASVLRFGGDWSSSSESNCVLCSAFRATLFLAVGGPTRGLLPLLLRSWSTCSCSSSKLVGRCLAAVRRSNVLDLLSPDSRAYSCVGWSSSTSSATGLNGSGFLFCFLGRLPAGVFGDGARGFTKSGRLARCLLGVVENPDVPGVESSSSSVTSVLFPLFRGRICSRVIKGSVP